jgi:hypothetical protein
MGYRWWIGVCVLLPLLAVVRAPVASAALPLGGGAGIIVAGAYCTLTTIGHDKPGDLVGFTAASCGGPDSPVIAEGSENLGPVGTVVAANDHMRYSVIKFDPAKITPIPNFDGFVINGIGPETEPGQPECRLGAATGDYCWVRPSPVLNPPPPNPNARRSMKGAPNYQPGDNGAPVTSNGLLVGLIFAGVYFPWPDIFITQGWSTTFVEFDAILDDVNSTGGPGAGFAPVPA